MHACLSVLERNRGDEPRPAAQLRLAGHSRKVLHVPPGIRLLQELPPEGRAKSDWPARRPPDEGGRRGTSCAVPVLGQRRIEPWTHPNSADRSRCCGCATYATACCLLQSAVFSMKPMGAVVNG